MSKLDFKILWNVKLPPPQKCFVTFPHQKTLLFGLTFFIQVFASMDNFLNMEKIRPTLENFLPNIFWSNVIFSGGDLIVDIGRYSNKLYWSYIIELAGWWHILLQERKITAQPNGMLLHSFLRLGEDIQFWGFSGRNTFSKIVALTV